MKQVSLTILLVIGFCFSNCSDDDNDCGNFVSLPHFDIQSLDDSSHYLLKENTTEILTDSSSVAYDDYAGFSIQFEVDYIAQLEQRSQRNWNFSLMNSVLACTPFPNGGAGSKTEKMESLQIITLNDFDLDYPAGSVINELLTIQGFNYDTPEPKVSVDTYLSQKALITSERFLLKPTKAPDENDFQVMISMELTGGEVYEITSPLIQVVD